MERPLKPHILGDIAPKTDRIDLFGSLPNRINLETKKTFHIPATKWLQCLAIGLAVAFLVFGSVTAPTTAFLTRAAESTVPLANPSSTTSDPAAERAALESQLSDLEGQINQYQGQITSYQKQGSTLKGQISTLNSQISKLNLQIRAINLTIAELDQNISQTQSEIAVTQSDIENKRSAIASLLQTVYKNDHVGLLEAFLKNPQLADFWGEAQNVALLQGNLRAAVNQTIDLQTQLQNKESELAASRSDATTAANYQRAQASMIATTQQQKNVLLEETKGQETRYQQLLKQTQATAAQLRDRIFQLLGGGQLSFESAYEYAKFAGNATGVDPALLLAVLDRESALGQNVGQCSYKRAMSPGNIPLFLQITQQLGLNPDSMLVSCANADGAYGGAMGPAQFVPATWNLYAAGVSRITNHNPPSPWSNPDAFAATALYLRDAMVGCKALYSSQASIERCTAAKYYAGGHWKSYLWTYGQAVVDRAQSFTNDIATITG
jgi:peptidoglycan hydrolase CwlO-like protein